MKRKEKKGHVDKPQSKDSTLKDENCAFSKTDTRVGEEMNIDEIPSKDVPLKGEDHKFTKTAMGVGKVLGKATLTPFVGLGLMGVAASDIVRTGVVGTKVRLEHKNNV